MKISALPELSAPDGNETVVVLKGGITKRAGLLAIVTAALATASSAAIATVNAAVAAAQALLDSKVANAAASVVSAGNAATAAAASALSAASYEAAAAAAAGVTLPNRATKAALDAAIGSYANGNFIYVVADETHGGEASIYSKTGGVAVYARPAGVSAQFDSQGRPRIPARLLGERSTGLHIRNALNKVRTGSRKYLVGLAVGDSLATRVIGGGPEQVARIFAEHFKNSPVSFATAAGGFNDGAGSGQLVTGKFDCTNNVKTDQAHVWVGCDQVFALDGKYGCYSGDSGGGALYCEHIRVMLLTNPGGGVFKVEIAPGATCPAVGSAAWVSPTADQVASGPALTGGELLVSTDAAPGMIIPELVLPYGQWHVKLTKVSGGNGIALPPFFMIQNDSAINTYRLAEGSNNFANESAAANPYMAALIANLQPDFAIACSDDQIGAYQNFLPLLETGLTSAALSFKPLVLIEGNPSNAADDAAIAVRIAYCQDFCASRLGWVTANLLSITGGYAEATRELVAGDGTHPYLADDVLYAASWRAFLSGLGLTASAFQNSASYRDIARGVGNHPIAASGIKALLASPARVDTAAMTWSGIAPSGGSVTPKNDNSIELATGTTANSTVVAYVNEQNPYFGRNNGSRPLAAEGGFSFQAKIVTANATGTARYFWPVGVGYNGAYNGPLAAAGIGFLFENNVVWGIYWNGSAETKTTFSHTMLASTYSEFVAVITTVPGNNNDALVEFYADGVPLNPGGSLFRKGGNVSAQRFEQKQTNGAEFKIRFAPPVIVTMRG